jgi:hypothetical protein
MPTVITTFFIYRGVSLHKSAFYFGQILKRKSNSFQYILVNHPNMKIYRNQRKPSHSIRAVTSMGRINKTFAFWKSVDAPNKVHSPLWESLILLV